MFRDEFLIAVNLAGPVQQRVLAVLVHDVAERRDWNQAEIIQIQRLHPSGMAKNELDGGNRVPDKTTPKREQSALVGMARLIQRIGIH